MHAYCPHCPHCNPAPGADPVAELRAACESAGYLVTPDGMVREDVAAALLGRSARTLENWAYAMQPLPFQTVNRRRMYRLADIAAMRSA